MNFIMPKTSIISVMIGLITMMTGCSGQKAASTKNGSVPAELTLLAGTYTSGTSKGIYSYRFDQETGKATLLGEVSVDNPSYLTVSPDGKFIYAVSELNNEQAAVSAFAFDKADGSFRFLNRQPSRGASPCYIVVHRGHAVIANYSGGSISVLPLEKDHTLSSPSSVFSFQGTGADKTRQRQAHLHCVRVTPDGRHLLAADLGSDRIYKFTVSNEKGKTFLTAGTPAWFTVAPGSGPRHLTFSPDGKFAYVINELSGTVVAFRYEENGNLKEIQSIAADTVGGRGSADIHISHDGKFLYASNRLKADGIAIFRINAENGTLAKTGYQLTGIHPRNFIITPNDKYLLVACRDSNVIQVFARDSETGNLRETQERIRLDKPVCLKFVE